MFVKICGLGNPAAVAAAVAAGVDAIGFVFAESIREIAPKQARALCQDLPDSIVRVAVMRHPSRTRFEAVIAEFDPDWIQTDADDFNGMPTPARARRLQVFREGEIPAGAALPTRLLFEGRNSGSGTPADWDEARRLATRTEVILAGGLHAGNVAAAIEYVRPFGVDVSSGVESERGRKDPEKIKEFVALVRAMERTQ
jgi:phosphoribosylanthranilate isomerase